MLYTHKYEIKRMTPRKQIVILIHIHESFYIINDTQIHEIINIVFNKIERNHGVSYQKLMSSFVIYSISGTAEHLDLIKVKLVNNFVLAGKKGEFYY